MRSEPTRIHLPTCIQARSPENPTHPEWEAGTANLRTGPQPAWAAAFHGAPVFLMYGAARLPESNPALHTFQDPCKALTGQSAQRGTDFDLVEVGGKLVD